jgi:hypothetical protein
VSCPALGKGKVLLGNVPSRYIRKFLPILSFQQKHWCIPLYNKCESFYSFNKCEISYRIEAPLEHCMSIQGKTFCEEILKLIVKKLAFKKKIFKMV